MQALNRYQHYDANLDKGYGRLTPKFHTPRSFVMYPEEPEVDVEADEEIDDQTRMAVSDKLSDYTPNDFYAKNKNDPFYYVGAATKLGETTAKGMVPFPNMYKNKQAISGGTSPKYPTGPTRGFQSRSLPTGTKKGYSKAPQNSINRDLESPYYRLSDFFDADNDEEHVKLVQKMVDYLHNAQ